MVDRPGRPLLLTGAIALVLVGVVVLGSLVWVRGTFGVWGVTFAPERIPLCDQTYTKRDDREFTYAEAIAQGTDPSLIILEPTIGRLPIPLAVPARYEPGAGYNGCGHLVLLHVADDGYVLYFKLGEG